MDRLDALQGQINRLDRQIEALEQRQSQMNRRLDHTSNSVNRVIAAVDDIDQRISAQVEVNRKQLSVLKQLYQQNKIVQEQRMDKQDERIAELLERLSALENS